MPNQEKKLHSKHQDRDVPGRPVVKTPPSKAGCVDVTPGQGAELPQASRPKTQDTE